MRSPPWQSSLQPERQPGEQTVNGEAEGMRRGPERKPRNAGEAEGMRQGPEWKPRNAHRSGRGQRVQRGWATSRGCSQGQPQDLTLSYQKPWEGIYFE